MSPKRRPSKSAKVLALLAGYPDKDVLAGVRDYPSSVDDCGDTLFTFLYREAEDMECDPTETLRVFERARDDIQAVIDHIEKEPR